MTRRQKILAALKAAGVAVNNEGANENGNGAAAAAPARRKKAASADSNSNSPAGPPVARSLTGISSLIATMPKGKKKAMKQRNFYEPHSVSFQCETVLGKFDESQLCWLCGFPINKFNQLQRIYPSKFKVVKPLLDGPVCEHVFPVKLAHAILQLLNLELEPSAVNEKLLHTEYEYAHNHCNYIKNDSYFVTLPLTAENKLPSDLCGLAINEEKIDKMLEDIFFYERKGKQSSVVIVQSTEDPTLAIKFPNPVQAYCYAIAGEEFLDEDFKRKYYETQWKPFAKRTIMAKTNRVIGYIKQVDFCGEAYAVEKRGSHYKAAFERLMKGAKQLELSEKSYPVPFAPRTGSTHGIILSNTNRPRPFSSNKFKTTYPFLNFNREGSVRTGDPSNSESAGNSNSDPGSVASRRSSRSNLDAAGAGAGPPVANSPVRKAMEEAIRRANELNAAGAGAGPSAAGAPRNNNNNNTRRARNEAAARYEGPTTRRRAALLTRKAGNNSLPLARRMG